MRALLGLALIALGAGCSGSPTQPQPDALTGRWEGTFVVTSCEATGTYSNCGTLTAGTTMLAGLLFLEPEGRMVTGYGHVSTHASDLLRREAMESGYISLFATSLSDGRLQFSSTFGKSPAFVYDLTWDLRFVGSRLEGTLRNRHHWYKTSGDFTVTGAVTLTRKD